jgi:hypothetical protein
MVTELDELVTRATNDNSPSGAGLHQMIISVLERTRKNWATLSDQVLAPDAVIGVGVGYAALTRDGLAVYEENGRRHCDLMKVAQAEELAKSEPERDWRIHLVSQLENRHYRREADSLWVLYERGYGLS